MPIRNAAQAVQRAFYAFWQLLYKDAGSGVFAAVRDKFPGVSGENVLKAVNDGSELNRVWQLSRTSDRPSTFGAFGPPKIGENNDLRVRISGGFPDEDGKVHKGISRIDSVSPTAKVADWEQAVVDWLNETGPGDDTIKVGPNWNPPKILGFIAWYE